jgi:REG-2-like HAD superfamily hydrolase
VAETERRREGGCIVIEAVFFDAGETLLSPQPSWSEICVDILRERGHEATVDQMRGAWAKGGQRFVQAADEGRTFSTSKGESRRFWIALYLELLEVIGIEDDEAAERMYQTFSDPKTYGLFPDAVPTLDELSSRGLRLGVISNFESWLRDLLHHLEVTERFEVIAISGDLGWEKPDPRIFKWALEEMGVLAERSMYVGDSPHFDPGPAQAVGMNGVLLDRHGRWVDLEGDYPRIASLGEIPALIESLG